jgi:hypothetical protein
MCAKKKSAELLEKAMGREIIGQFHQGGATVLLQL